MRPSANVRFAAGAVAGLAVLGGVAGIFIAQQRRHDRVDAEASNRPMPVDTFVDTILEAFDTRSYVDPLQAPPMRGDAGRRDGQLALGAEDTARVDLLFHPDVLDRSPRYYEVLSGRRFLESADTDDDSVVTRAELTAAVAARAGADALLDRAERRRILVDDGLAQVMSERDLPRITGWGRNGLKLTTAGAAAVAAMRELGASGDPATLQVRLRDLDPVLPWADAYQRTLKSGWITSMRAPLGRIDAAGDGDGTVTVPELAAWIAETYAADDLLPGHVRIAGTSPLDELPPQVIGRIRVDGDQVTAWREPDLAGADVDRWYGGDVGEHVRTELGGSTAVEGIRWLDSPPKT